ncbi:MAG: hypothetical protein ACOYMZ_02495 [Minisyncoccia bacterium]
MDKQAYNEKIQQSGLSAESNQKIADLLNSSELTFDVKEMIKDIIQADIESDPVALDAEDIAAARALDEELVAGLAAVEHDLAQDMAVVETELADLEGMTSEMDKAVDEQKIEALKADIQS